MSSRSVRMLKMVLQPELSNEHNEALEVNNLQANTDNNIVIDEVLLLEPELRNEDKVALAMDNFSQTEVSDEALLLESEFSNEDEVVQAVDNLQTAINGNELASEAAVNLLSPKTQDYSRPSTSKESYADLDDAASSDLEFEQERLANDLAAILEDSDCSIKDKDYVPDSDTSSEKDVFEKGSPNTSLPEKLAASTRWKKCDPSNWKKNIKKRQTNETKAPKPIDCSKCRFKCTDKLTQDVRNMMCKSFWSIDFNRRKDFILSKVESHPPERRRSTQQSTKRPRLDSKRYFLEHENLKIRVCRDFFTKTLSISKEVVEHAFKFKGEEGLFASSDQRGKKEPYNKTKDSDVEVVKKHIESFPVMESHYSRKYTKRQYLDCKLSIGKMHTLYKEFCEKENLKPVSVITYRRIFCNNYNLSFFTPKKDQCQTCAKYKTADSEKRKPLEGDYESHIVRKNDCYKAKMEDKERTNLEDNFTSCTFDLQCVLQIPSSDVSLMYYSRKICTYNLTVYELAKPNNAFCFSWTELNGKRGSLEIGTCLLRYIDKIPSSVTELSLFSDTCSGQNRNQNVSALFLYLVQTKPNLSVIEQKFLESGHSYMEVDSMHSAIEKAQKYVPVYTMHDWLNIFRMARTSRSNKKPFSVEELKYNDFFDLEALSKLIMRNKNKNTNGEKVSWLKIKCLKYLKSKPGIILYRYDHSSDYNEINVFGKGRPINLNEIVLKKAYVKPRPISIQKKQDLLKLCKSGAIPDEFHQYYKSLPTSKNIKENTIPEPDIQDSDSQSDSDE